MMDKEEIIERLERIADNAVHAVGEKPFIMSLDDGIAVHEAIEIIRKSNVLEVLQEIRAELTKYYVDPYNRNAFRYTTVSLLEVLDLIDKHIKEYTNETNN